MSQRATVLLPLDLQERDWRGEVERGRTGLKELTRRYLSSIREKRSDSNPSKPTLRDLLPPFSQLSTTEKLVIVPGGIFASLAI